MRIVDTGLWNGEPYAIIDENGKVLAHSVADGESGIHSREGLEVITSRIAALEAQLEEAKKIISPFAENYKAFLRTNDASNIRKGWFTELQQAYEYMNKVTQ